MFQNKNNVVMEGVKMKCIKMKTYQNKKVLKLDYVIIKKC